MQQSIIYLGLDVHKDTIVVALAEAGIRSEVRQHGTTPNTRVGARIDRQMLAARDISVTYETIRQWGLKFGREFAETAASSGVMRLRSLAGRDRWLAGISVQSRNRVYHYRQRNEPEAADRRRVVTTASAAICSSDGSPGNWPSLR